MHKLLAVLLAGLFTAACDVPESKWARLVCTEQGQRVFRSEWTTRPVKSMGGGEWVIGDGRYLQSAGQGCAVERLK